MKRIIPLLIAVFIGMMPTAMYGQKGAEEAPLIKLFNAYEDKEGVESISISPALLGLMKSGKSNDKKTQELISKISELRIITLTDNGKGSANRKAFTAELDAIVKTDFTRVMMVKNAGERVELFVQQKSDCKDCASALLFTTSASKTLTVMHLAGTIDKAMIDAVMNGEIGVSNK